MREHGVGDGERGATPPFFEEWLDGMQLYRLLASETSEPEDFVVTRSNRAFAEQTHLGDCVNRRGREIRAFVDAFPQLLKLFTNVAVSGNAQRTEVTIPTTGRTFQVSAYRLSEDLVAAQWSPITTDPQQTRALREVTRHVRFLIEHVPAAIAVFGREMRYLAVSRRYIEDYRLIRDDLIGRIHYEVVPEFERWREVHSRCVRGETLSGREEPFPRPDGTVDWVSWEMRPWYDDTGAIGGVVLFSEVLTQAKAAQRALLESEADREGLFAFAAMGIARADPETRRLVEVNPYFCDFLGYTAAELLTMNVDDFTHPDDRELDRNMFLAARREERSVFQYEKRYVRKDGGLRWGRVTLAIVRRSDGVPRTIATIQDITEQRASHAALSLQASALDAAANAIAITDPAGVVEYMNPAFAALTGYSREEMCGRTMGLLRSGRQPPAFYATMKETISAGRVWQGELINRRKNGTLYHESMTITPVRNEQGAISQFIAIKMDISERKEREASAMQLEERHRLALDAVALGTWTLDFDTDGTVTLDERAQQHLNVAYHTATSAELTASLDPRDVIDSREVMARAISEGRDSFHYVLRVKNEAGEIRWISAHARIHRGGDGPPRIFGTSQDITQARRAEEELQRSEERYRLLVDSLEDVVFAADVDRRITFISRAITRFGYSPSDLVGRHLHEFIHPADISTVMAARELGTGHTFEYRLMDASGVARPVRSYSHPLIIDHAVVGMIGVVIDQTAQRNIEDQLRAAQKMEAVGRLAGGIAHDFNNLLSVILAYSELAMRNLAAAAPERADLEEVRQAARRAQVLTRQLLTFSRRQVMKPEPIDLDELVAGVGKMLKRVIGEDLELCFVSNAERHDIEADRGNMEQLIMNLAVNARDAMPDGGRLTIGLHRRELVAADTQAMGIVPGSYVELSVIDTGCGMDETTRARLFEPFFTTKDVGKGTGLGLSTVYGIVQASAGALVVESAVGKGSTFRVYLPYHARPGDVPAQDQRSGIAARGHETVLVVEDEPALRNVVRRLLQAAGYEVITAADASAALEICSRTQTPIELLLTDVIMPGMSGRELVRRLHATHPDLKVVFTSGYTKEMADPEGMPYFLPKPYDWRSLTEIVRSALDGVPAKIAS